jgi:hypothetical protein
MAPSAAGPGGALALRVLTKGRNAEVGGRRSIVRFTVTFDRIARRAAPALAK